jgi:hypothetical protein
MDQWLKAPHSWVKATVTTPVSFRVQRLGAARRSACVSARRRELLEPPFDELRVIGIFPIMVSLSNHALTVTESPYFVTNMFQFASGPLTSKYT